MPRAEPSSMGATLIYCTRWCPAGSACLWPSVGRPSLASTCVWPGGRAEARDHALSALLPVPGTRGAVAALADASGSRDAPLVVLAVWSTVCDPCICMSSSCRVLSLSAFSRGTLEGNTFTMIGAGPTATGHAGSWPQVAQTSAVPNGRSTRLQHQETIPASRTRRRTAVQLAPRAGRVPSASPTTLYKQRSPGSRARAASNLQATRHLASAVRMRNASTGPHRASECHTRAEAFILI